MGGCLSRKTAEQVPLLQPGAILGRGNKHAVRVLRRLGQGAWAECYLVERVTDGRRYALKRTLISELSETEKWVAVNEVRLLASLHHPNVVQYKQCFVEDSCLHVVMEVVPNGELAAVIEQHRRDDTRIPEDQIWGYLLQIAVGLQYLHSAGIIHRDIKPANILVGHEGVLKIADLGVAGLLHMGSSKLQIGTPQYMPPEMHQGLEYSYAADVWSLGCLVYELCALEPLFGDRDEEAVARKVLATALPPALPSKYSPELQIVVNRMLQQDPSGRPSVTTLLQLPQLQSRVHLLPDTLEEQVSMGSISLDCLEGVPVLPPIDVPEDLLELNRRLPPSRYSFDSMDGAGMDIAAKFGAPAIRRPSTSEAPPSLGRDSAAAAEAAGVPAAAALLPRQQRRQQQQQQRFSLPRIASPVTVLDAEEYGGAGSTVGTPSMGPGTGGSGMSAIESAVAAALLEEERQGAAGGSNAWRKSPAVPHGAAAWASALGGIDGADI